MLSGRSWYGALDMVQPKDVIDLLASQPDDVLDGMADQLKGTIEQAQAQLELVEAARNRRAPRRPTRQDADPGAAQGPRAHYLKRDDLFQIVAEQGRPVRPAEIRAILVDRGYEIATAAVRTGMARLVDRDGRLVRLEEGLYAVNYGREIGANRANGNGSGDSPSRAPGQVREPTSAS